MTPLLASLIAADRVSQSEALFWIGLLIVAVCLIAAVYCVVQLRQYVGAAILVVVAIVAAVLLI